jgi:hypothetical protein
MHSRLSCGLGYGFLFIRAAGAVRALLSPGVSAAVGVFRRTLWKIDDSATCALKITVPIPFDE